MTYYYQQSYRGSGNEFIDGKPMDKDKNLDIIIWALLIEHFLSYLIAYFRQYDIARNGELDIHGVPHAKRESVIGNIQSLLVCMIVGFSIKQLVMLDSDELRHQSYLYHWVIIDCLIILLQRYVFYVFVMMANDGEIIKNIYTLYFTQYKILK